MMKYLEIAIKKDIKEFINYYYDECIKEFNNIIKVIDENLEKMLAIEELQKGMDMLRKMKFYDELQPTQLKELNELEEDITHINYTWELVNEQIESILCYQNIYISTITRNIAYLLLVKIKDDQSELEELLELGDKYLLIAKHMKNLFTI